MSDLTERLRNRTQHCIDISMGCPECELRQEAAARITELEAFIRDLGISVMHPDMGGNHQATIKANGRRLNAAGWRIVRSCDSEDTDD